VFLPSPLTAGPWSPAAQHGGPPSGLLARAAELHRTTPDEDPAGLFLARITVELLRPVPVASAIRVVTATLRPGWKVQLIGVSLMASGSGSGESEVARAAALRLRIAPVELPAVAWSANREVDAAACPPGPASGRAQRPGSAFDATGFHAEAVEMRFVRGALGEPGPGAMWVRLLHPLVDDEAISPVQRAVTLADFGNAVGSVVPPATHSFINADLSVNLHRRPQGEWVGLDSVMRVDPDGIGLAACQLLDEHGPIGRSAQSLLIAAR
jgi:hypothetical protein